MLQQDVIQPFNVSIRSQTDSTKLPPFTYVFIILFSLFNANITIYSIELKKMERSYGLHLVFDQIPKLKHKSDGIVWTPVKCPYVSGTCEKL
jgi:hypothetical protein